MRRKPRTGKFHEAEPSRGNVARHWYVELPAGGGLCRLPHLDEHGGTGGLAVAGILAALAAEFGVSGRFVAVRVSLYGLIKGGR